MLDDDARVRLDLPEHAFIKIVGSVRSMHHKNPSTVRLEIKRFEGTCEALWSPPLCEMFRIFECHKDLAGSGGEDPLGADEAIRVGRIGHLESFQK